MALATPRFISSDVIEITNDMISFYESLTGKTLQPAQPERLLIDTFAYREARLRNDINDACLQNLVEFARFPFLDYLGAFVGATRLVAQKAQTTIEFNLITGHSSLTIQQGTRVSNTDGTAIFSVINDVFVNNVTDVVTILCESITEGIAYNNFLAGSINTLLDTFVGFDFCSNVDNSSGGSDEETDDAYRSRIKLAPSVFSVAGPLDAYKYFAFSANPLIKDVSVYSPIPGQINIYPLTDIVPTPTLILNEVYNICNAEKVRPDTDTVLVLAPTAINYSINLDLTLYSNSDDVFISQQVTSLVTNYSVEKAGKMGIDIIIDQIKALAMVDGVYKSDLTSLGSDLIISETEFGNCTSVTVNIIGYNNG